MTRRGRSAAALGAIAALAAGAALAQDDALSYTMWGQPGLIDMPVAVSASDGMISGTFGASDAFFRTTFSFQLSPRAMASFRYGALRDMDGPGEGFAIDRSFDLSYRLLDEEGWRPSVTIGLRDFLATGAYSSEYIVASKVLGDRFRVSAGLGWGRMASHGGFDNPLAVFGEHFETRPALDFGAEGEIETNQYFRGDAALFGGIEWSVNEALTIKAEYSSDEYAFEQALGTVDYQSPVNLGLVWYAKPGIQLSFAWLHGTTLAASVTATLNPNAKPLPTGFGDPPPPVAARDSAAAASWGLDAAPAALDEERLARALRAEGISLDGYEIRGDTVRIRYSNHRYRAEAQGLGRVARVLSRELPAGVETFVLEPQASGIPMAAVTVSRTDLERLENVPGSSAAMLAAADIRDAGPRAGLTQLPDASPFSWRISPYGGLSLIGDDNRVQFSGGVQVSGRYEIMPNLVFSGAIRHQLLNTAPEVTQKPDYDASGWFTARGNSGYYLQEGTTAIERLTLAWYGRPGANLYSRVTAGLLERQYGGVSAELLWQPVDSRLGLGIELDYVRQRDFDGGLGFRDYETVTGMVSAYYEVTESTYLQVDAGRFLAGDWGANFLLEREFDNGWRVGAYATLTEMSGEDFGIGEFRKGVVVTIPLDYFTGNETRQTQNLRLNTPGGDGGAQVSVPGRLYDAVRSGHLDELEGSWGRFWR